MERRVITITGIVQGVGFRPFVFRLAQRLQLTGFIRNQAGRVLIEAEGEREQLDEFVQGLRTQAPSVAHLDEISWERTESKVDGEFVIDSSQHDGSTEIFVAPDIAMCGDCRAELLNPSDRRFRYAFLNCTHCGPRLTIIQGAPYDRARTTMSGFAMCAECRAEYNNPHDRRFHAQPIACPKCGPELCVLGSDGRAIATADAIEAAAKSICRGEIVAVKGIGGFHLSCDATSSIAVERLRRQKEREARPFAVMVPDLQSAESICEMNGHERELLMSVRAPILLLRRRRGDSTSGRFVSEFVAPHNPYLGIMLPYTPLHELLMKAVNGLPLVMTSGNRSDEPIAYETNEALAQLREIADLFLTHNRPIRVRCDDSVTRIVAGEELPVRRSRGYAPQPVAVSFECREPILAVGGQLKSTFALGRGQRAILSHHMGDLDHYRAYCAFVRDLELYEELFEFRPSCIVHDLHPDYASTRYALERQRATGDELAIVGVQHHHAHLASCMAENGLSDPVIGIIFDGTGYGTDGAIWGGEFLVGNYEGFCRMAHLRYVPLAGGDRAARELWRMALAHLSDAEMDCPSLTSRLRSELVRTVRGMIERRLNSPNTSSMGRLFDAVASLAGVRDVASYEAQGAIELEWLATDVVDTGSYPIDVVEQPSSSSEGMLEDGMRWSLDTRPMIREVVRDVANGVTSAVIARRFHTSLVRVIVDVCERIRAESGLNSVVLSGGVFANSLLLTEGLARLREAGFDVFRHRKVPPNDGGLSLGQLAVAAGLVED